MQNFFLCKVMSSLKRVVKFLCCLDFSKFFFLAVTSICKSSGMRDWEHRHFTNVSVLWTAVGSNNILVSTLAEWTLLGGVIQNILLTFFISLTFLREFLAYNTLRKWDRCWENSTNWRLNWLSIGLVYWRLWVQTLAALTLRVFQLLRRKCGFSNDSCQWLDFQVFPHKDNKQEVLYDNTLMLTNSLGRKRTHMYAYCKE